MADKCGYCDSGDITCPFCETNYICCKWISVNALWPEEHQVVDVFVNSKNRITDCEFINGDFFDTVCVRWIKADHVTHWMPRPPPPEEGE